MILQKHFWNIKINLLKYLKKIYEKKINVYRDEDIDEKEQFVNEK